MKPYLYHTIITDLVTGELQHYFGKHNGKNPKYKGSGSCIAKATAANKRLRSKQQPPRFLLEHIIVQEFETMKECSENEKYLIATGNEQFGMLCKNVRTEDYPDNPFMYFPEYQEEVSKNKSAAVKAAWAIPEAKARRLAKWRKTDSDKLLAKLPGFTERDICEIAKLISQDQFVAKLKELKVSKVKTDRVTFLNFAEPYELGCWNDFKDAQKIYLEKGPESFWSLSGKFNAIHLEAYESGADTYQKMYNAIGKSDELPTDYRSIVDAIHREKGILEEVMESRVKKNNVKQYKSELLEIWKQKPCYAPEFKKKAIVLGYPEADYTPIIAEFAESTGIKLAITPHGPKFKGEIAARFDSLKALWLENRLSYHKFRAVAVANGYENRSYQGFVQHMMMHY